MSAKRRVKDIIRRIGLGRRRKPPKPPKPPKPADPPLRCPVSPTPPGAGHGPGVFVPARWQTP